MEQAGNFFKGMGGIKFHYLLFYRHIPVFTPGLQTGISTGSF
jgi:hypothetical protein